MPKLGGKGCVIHSQAREIVFNVYNYFKNNQEGDEKQSVIIGKVEEATRIARRTVERILQDAKKQTQADTAVTTPLVFTTPRKVVKRPRPVSDLDSFDLDALRRIVNNFHLIHKSCVTVKKILQEVRNSGIGFRGGETTLRHILRKLGFRWKKTQDNRKTLVERHDIKYLRIKYLRQISQFRKEGRPIIYTDETYIHSSHTKPMSWVDTSNEKVGLKKPISKGSRLIVVHAGSSAGFVQNALLMFKSGLKTGDYHDDMNSTNYLNWIRTRLIPNLPPQSVIVMDNASYHNILSVKQPTSNSLKTDMIKWLEERNIEFNVTHTKPELYELIKSKKEAERKFTVDAVFKEYGHSVLRLPPYHPELNPIEKIWATVKGKVAAKNVTFKMDDVITLATEAFNEVSAEHWDKVCNHVIDVEKKYIEDEHMWGNLVERIVISVNDTDSETDQSEADSDDDMDLGVGELPSD